MPDWNSLGIWQDGRVVIPDKVFLKAFMESVFQKTVGDDPSAWLKDGVEKDEYFDQWPGGTVFQDHWNEKRKSGAIDGTVANAACTFVKAAFDGNLKKFTAIDTSRNLTKFLCCVCGTDDRGTMPDGAPTKMERKYSTQLDFYDDTDACVIENKKEALLEVVEMVFERAVSGSKKSKSVDVTNIPFILNDAEKAFRKTVEPDECAITDEILRYHNLFYEDLFLEGSRVMRASVDRTFVTPSFEIIKGSDANSSVADDFFKLLKNFFAGKISDSAPTLNNNVNIMTILGQPGSGKTTLMSAVVAKRHEDGFVPKGMDLHCVRLSRLADTDFIQSRQPMHFICRNMNLERKDFSNSIVILDGLDELCMVLAAGATIDDFYETLLEDVQSFENCKLVVTSRLNYVQSIINKPNLTHIIELKSFNRGQVAAFAGNIDACRGETLNPRLLDSVILKSKEFDFLTVPLLLYMTLALELDVGATEELSDLYDQMFDAMSERPYGDSKKHLASESFDPRAVARALAVEMRRLNRGYLDAEEAEDVLGYLDFPLDEDGDDYESYLKTIEKSYGLTFFYRNRDLSSFAPEFYHRSFAEYLAAEQIFIELSNAVSKGDAGMWDWWKDMDYLLGGEEIQEAVVGHFAHIVKKNNMTEPITENMSKWLFNTFVKTGMTYGAGDHDDLYDSVTKGLLLFLNYWHLLKALKPNGSVVHFEQDEDCVAFASLLRLASRIKSRGLCFDYEDFHWCDLEDIDFSDCSLIGADFFKAELSHCIFSNADLSDANLVDTFLYFVDFNGADLTNAKVDTSNIYFCNLKDAKGVDHRAADKLIKGSVISKNSKQSW